jgi:hypothetical protein
MFLAGRVIAGIGSGILAGKSQPPTMDQTRQTNVQQSRRPHVPRRDLDS